jgi:hypothetical protein
MNLQEFPTRIKNDIEDQSLQILSQIHDALVIIGGWGEFVHMHKKIINHCTLDIDAIH